MSKRGFASDDSDDDGKRGRFDEDPNAQLDAMLAANFSGGMIPPHSTFSGVLGPNGTGTGFGGAPFGGGGMGMGMGMDMSMAMEPKTVETTPMDFSRLAASDKPSRRVHIAKELGEYLMTSENRQVLTEETGADVEWLPDSHEVELRGSAEQVKKAQRVLARVTTHCHWGRSEAKVKRLLKPRVVESVRIVLSPMNTLRPAEKVLSMAQGRLKIGNQKTNDIVIQDATISRTHCVLELDSERGAVYVLDTSTNGTFLNSRRLPSKSAGKVLLSHGDELLLKDPSAGESEFGFIVNIQELHVREEVKLEAPRRLLSADEINGPHREFL